MKYKEYSKYFRAVSKDVLSYWEENDVELKPEYVAAVIANSYSSIQDKINMLDIFSTDNRDNIPKELETKISNYKQEKISELEMFKSNTEKDTKFMFNVIYVDYDDDILLARPSNEDVGFFSDFDKAFNCAKEIDKMIIDRIKAEALNNEFIEPRVKIRKLVIDDFHYGDEVLSNEDPCIGTVSIINGDIYGYSLYNIYYGNRHSLNYYLEGVDFGFKPADIVIYERNIGMVSGDYNEETRPTLSSDKFFSNYIEVDFIDPIKGYFLSNKCNPLLLSFYEDEEEKDKFNRYDKLREIQHIAREGLHLSFTGISLK